MNFVVDVGNTAVKIGIFDGSTLVDTFSFYTDAKLTADEINSKIIPQLSLKNIDVSKIDKVMISSVVPMINEALGESLVSIFHLPVKFIGPGVKNGLVLKVDNPLEVGADLISDLVAGKEFYSFPLAIVDFGTATKVLILDKDGAFISCAFMPGVKTSVKALKNQTALLNEIVIKTAKPLVKVKNTEDAINAGIIYGQIGAVKEIIGQYEKELGYSLKKIFSGGPSPLFRNYLDETYLLHPNLTLEGINIILNKQK